MKSNFKFSISILNKLIVASITLGTIGCSFLYENDSAENGLESEATEPPQTNVESNSSVAHIGMAGNNSPIKSNLQESQPSEEKIYDPNASIHWQKFFTQSQPNEQFQPSEMDLSLDKGISFEKQENYFEMAYKLEYFGKFDEAEAIFKALIRNFPKLQKAKLALISNYLSQKKPHRASLILDELKTSASRREFTNPNLFFQYRYLLALTSIQKTDTKLGHRILSEILKKDPRFTPAYATLGLSYFNLGMLEAAHFTAKKGIQRAGPDPNLFNILGMIASEKEQDSKAKNWFTKGLEVEANHIPCLMNRTKIHLKKLDFTNALNDINKVLDRRPNHLEANLAKSIYLRKTGQKRKAMALLETLINRFPESPEVRFNLAMHLQEDPTKIARALQLFGETLQVTDKKSKLHKQAKMQHELLLFNDIK